MNYSTNYLNISTISYSPTLKQYRNTLMLTPEQRTEVAVATNDSALRLYEYYISKANYKHFSPIEYAHIGESLGWARGKTEKCKTMLVKAGYLLIKKDTLKDGTKVFRILLGKDLIKVYNETKVYPDEVITLGTTR